MAGRITGGLLFIIMLAVLELNRNTIAGWVVFILLTAAAVFLLEKTFKDKRLAVRLGVWAAWLTGFAAVFILSWPPTQSIPAVSGVSGGKTDIITTDKGAVSGVYNSDRNVEVYAGIPYAMPPVGELRWKAPEDPEPWEGVLEADHFAPMSMQPVNTPIYNSLKQIIGFHDYSVSLDDNFVPPVSEDSLYLNIWKPAGDVSGLPVLVYIHGGSLQTGQPWFADYSGEGLAEKGIIVVNLAYRLGVFGYYADEQLIAESACGTTGNYGLLDQIKALEWVRDNISAFGGDPSNVTVSGESAGSASVSALCTSPLAKGLFRRVILESSTVASAEPPHSFRLLDEALRSGNEMKARYGCSDISGLRSLDANTLVNEAYTQHHMTVDGYALTETPYVSYKKGIYNEEAILHGCNSEESAPFIFFSHASLADYETRVRDHFKDYADDILELFPAASDKEADENWAEIYGAVFFNYPHYCLHRLAVENSIPVYEYLFTKKNGRLGPWHSGEMVYCYGNIPANSTLYNDYDRKLSDIMSGYWLNFIKTGDPNAEGLPEWEQNTSSDRLMELGDSTAMTQERLIPLYDILDRMTGYSDIPHETAP